MHSPNEIVQLDDLENAARLIAEYLRGLAADTDFIR
jgi:putative aminopeptidase FrvX